MKLLIFLFVFISPSLVEPEITFVRSLFQQAVDEQEQAAELIEYLYSSKPIPIFLGYTGAATMLLGKHAYNPISKYNYFREGKEMLEKAIVMDGTSCELRYLRFSIQSNTPGFLNYKQHIEADKIFLINSLKNKASLDKETQKNIVNVLSNSTYCSDSEKKLVKEMWKWNK